MAIALLLIGISLFDLRYHRIPNKAVLALVLVITCYGSWRFSFHFFIVSAVVAHLFQYISRCGFGDVKLVLVLVNSLVSRTEIANYLLFVLVASFILSAAHLIRWRSFSGDIALAPALCGGVIALHGLSYY